jgi:Double zinc ribbon
MALAIFGITNSALNLVATLFVLMLVVLWLALIVYTYLDARRRISDPFLIACATVASFFPYIGTAVYAIVRPPEFLEDAHERELEIKAAELKVRQLREQSCPNCEYPVEKSYLRCPNCQRRLKDPCPTCGKPVDPRWGLCPYCESKLTGGKAERGRRPQKEERRPERSRREAEAAAETESVPRRQPARRKKAPAAAKSSAKADRKEPARGAPDKGSDPKPEQRSPSREPDPDPRQA